MNDFAKCPCPIWQTIAKKISDTPLSYDSPRAGGIFSLTPTALAVLDRGQLSDLERNKLTSWLVEQREMGDGNPLIRAELIEKIPDAHISSLVERRDKLLSWLLNRTNGLFGGIVLVARYNPVNAGIVGAGKKSWDETHDLRNLYEVTALSGCRNETEVIEIINHLISTKLLEQVQNWLKLSFEGHEQVDRIRKAAPLIEQAFVAMWFGPQMNEAYELGFKPAIEDAGYKPVRIDRKDHNNKIDDEIIAEIRRSRFVVADFTSDVFKRIDADGSEKLTAISRGGVYFEAGFAKGLGREVIWTARNDLIELVHFDTRQFNHITWTAPEELRDKLSKRISATLGDGPLKKQKTT